MTKICKIFRRNRLFQTAVVSSLLLLLALLLVAVAWCYPQQVLTVDSGPVTADVMVVPGGFPDRAVRAAELFKEGEAPKIIVSGAGDNASNEKLLEKDGVPKAYDDFGIQIAHDTGKRGVYHRPAPRASCQKRNHCDFVVSFTPGAALLRALRAGHQILFAPFLFRICWRK